MQQLGTQQSKFYRKICDYFQFSKLEELAKKSLFFVHFIMKMPDTNLYHGQPLSSCSLKKNIMQVIYTYLGRLKINARE